MSKSTEKTPAGCGDRRAVLLAITIAITVSTFGCAPSAGKRPAPTTSRTNDGFVISETARVSLGSRSDFDRGVRALANDDYDQAIEAFDEVVAADPLLAAAQINLGIAHARAGNLEAAEKSLRAALEANPRHPIAHNELAMVLRRTGRFAEARSSYEAALDLQPSFHFAQRNLGILCDLYLSDIECALEHYEKYVEAVPDDETAQIWVTDLRNRLGR